MNGGIDERFDEGGYIETHRRADFDTDGGVIGGGERPHRAVALRGTAAQSSSIGHARTKSTLCQSAILTSAGLGQPCTLSCA
jgi:hypothetical protein